ncbi:hypothetical protein V8G54_010340 [Vigna mungo]|uniref:GED domain-containing protein n=1 Tax=Vigna mungo TaxID=3915 RepID=A0AAQ3S5P0_VIGMU
MVRSGGDKIYNVFDNQFPAALRKLPFDRHLSLQNVRKVVSEADGYQPHLIAPEQGYRRLIEGALSYFRGPAEASVDAELRRFPTLQAELAAATNEALERFREESKKTAIRLVDMEASYLTVEFFRRLPQEMEKAGTPANQATPKEDRYGEGHYRRIGSNPKQLSQLLDEDPALMERRQQCAKRLELYKAARDEIDSVSWTR